MEVPQRKGSKKYVCVYSAEMCIKVSLNFDYIKSGSYPNMQANRVGVTGSAYDASLLLASIAVQNHCVAHIQEVF